VSLLNVTKKYAARETVEAVETAIALAEKCGDLNQLAKLLASRGGTLLVAGDFSAAASALNRALLLGSRQGASLNLAVVHQQQTFVRYWLGDLEGAEKHFRAWHALFDESDLKRSALGTALNIAVNAFAFGSYIAWISGRANIARQRETQMLAVASRGKSRIRDTSRSHSSLGNTRKPKLLLPERLNWRRKIDFPILLRELEPFWDWRELI
jgi:hypothetical protein